MFCWKEVLQPVTSILPSQTTVQEILLHISKNKAELVLIEEKGVLAGYADRDLLLELVQQPSQLHEPIKYRKDILIVPLDQEIELYHNISIYVGVNSDGTPLGYSTFQDIRQKTLEFRYEQMKQLNAGAGVGIITTNELLEITFVNEMAEDILGLSSGFLLGRNYSHLMEMEHNLTDVLAGKSLVSVNSYFNYKHMIGNFTRMDVNGQITGLVHIFFLREQWEEAVGELEFVRDLNEDMQAIYSSSKEQIMVVNSQGTILRLAGTFLQNFWVRESPDQVVGSNMFELETQGVFQPSIVGNCIKKERKLTCIQEGRNGSRFWSVATPVFHEGKVAKVVVISRDITEVNRLREQLAQAQQVSEGYKQEIDQLKGQTEKETGLIYRSREMAQVVDQIRMVAKVNSTVLILGETGVGKEVIAHTIHKWSNRNAHRFIRINCGAIPEELIESELFGYEKGAFTGADPKGKAGYFEQANRGTIFLDEISELPLNMQVKLLRVLQEKEVSRIGGTKMVPLDTRIIAAANKDLWELVQAGKFREDLFYRLHVIPIHIPPLRKRKADLTPLSLHFLKHYNQLYNKEKQLSNEALALFEDYQWNGNVRELQNIIERLVVTSHNDFIHTDDVLSILYPGKKEIKKSSISVGLMPLKEAVEEVEKQLIKLGLQKYGTAAKASEALGISTATISRRRKKLMV